MAKSPPPQQDDLRSIKQDLRWERWNALREAGGARFPGLVGRIPNFKGAEQAAVLLAGTRLFQRAAVCKCNPDLPQRPLRHRALQEGKVLYVAVPRLREDRPFLCLDPALLAPEDLWRASSIAGAAELGRPVTLEQLRTIDLIVTGAVAVSPDGGRLGKGGGFADLEYALLREAGKVGPRTPVVTLVHPTQVTGPGEIPMAPHDVPLDRYATPDEVVACGRTYRRPRGILWPVLDEKKQAEIPVLARRRRARGIEVTGRGAG